MHLPLSIGDVCTVSHENPARHPTTVNIILQESIMSMLRTLFGTTLTLLVVAAANLAAQQPPSPPHGIELLKQLAGKFEGKATMTMGENTVNFMVHHVNTTSSGGWGVKINEESEIPGLGRYISDGVFGFDVYTDMLHLYSVSNVAETHDHAGRWSDDRHVTLVYEGQQEGKKFVEKINVEIVSRNEYHINAVQSLEGTTIATLDVVMKRKG